MKKIIFIMSFIFIASCGNEIDKYDRHDVLGDLELEWNETEQNSDKVFLYPEVNPQFVKDFWKYMSKNYGTTITNKHNSKFMSFIGSFLSSFGIMDKDIFLNDYATTIKKTIYLPFVIGDTVDKRELLGQIFLCVHEHQHVVQYNKYQKKYSAGYLFNHRKRAYFETEAYSTSIEIYYWFFKEILDTQYLANKLSSYDCDQKDIDRSKKSLDITVELVKTGKIYSESSKVAILWLNKNAKNLQEEKEQK